MKTNHEVKAEVVEEEEEEEKKNNTKLFLSVFVYRS